MSHLLSFSYQAVPLAAIAFDLCWSLHPWMGHRIPASLQDSFKRSGIINPPCLIPAENGTRYTILTGHRRILFAQANENSCQEVICRCCQSRPTFRQCLDIILADQQYSEGGLSITEKAQFLRLASTIRSEETILEEIFPLLNLKKNPELLKNLQHLAQENEQLLQATHTGKISLQIYTELQHLPEEDRIVLLELFEELQLGGGKQRRFLEQIRDAAYSRSQTIRQFLGNQEINQILRNSKLNIPQKIQHLGNVLQNLLQPSLQQAEQNFRNAIQQLFLPENYEVEHSPAFEKDEIALKITFPNLDACRKYLIKNRR